MTTFVPNPGAISKLPEIERVWNYNTCSIDLVAVISVTSSAAVAMFKETRKDGGIHLVKALIISDDLALEGHISKEIRNALGMYYCKVMHCSPNFKSGMISLSASDRSEHKYKVDEIQKVNDRLLRNRMIVPFTGNYKIGFIAERLKMMDNNYCIESIRKCIIDIKASLIQHGYFLTC